MRSLQSKARNKMSISFSESHSVCKHSLTLSDWSFSMKHFGFKFPPFKFKFSICACGNSLFCHSTEYIQQRTDPNISCFTTKFISDFSFCLKTRAAMLCLSIDVCPGSKSCCVSSQAGLHVNIVNRSGCP